MRACFLARRASLTSLVAVLVVTGPGCRTWRPSATLLPVAQAITDSDGRPLRLHTRSAGRIEVHDARVEGDSVIGRRWTRAPAHRNAPVAVPLADVQTVEEHRVSAGRTALAVAGAAVGALAVLALIATSGDAQIGFD